MNQREALRTIPTLDLFFAPDRVVHVLEGLEINQPINVVSLGEAVGLASFVLKSPAIDVVRNTRIQRARAARDDVDPVFVFFSQMQIPRCARDDK